MKLASFYRKKLVPNYERLEIVTRSIQEALLQFEQLQLLTEDTFAIKDSRYLRRRDHVLSNIYRTVNALPSEWAMVAEIKRAGGGFHYLLLRFEDLNVTLVPIHLPSHIKLPRRSGYRGDLSALNFAVMQERGMQAEMNFQTHFTFQPENIEVNLSPFVPDDIKDIPFGLFLIYDGGNVKAPIRLAALAPEQDHFIFCENVELLRQFEVSTNFASKRPVATKKKKAVQLDTSRVADYTQQPNIALKQNKIEKRTDVK